MTPTVIIFKLEQKEQYFSNWRDKEKKNENKGNARMIIIPVMSNPELVPILKTKLAVKNNQGSRSQRR